MFVYELCANLIHSLKQQVDTMHSEDMKMASNIGKTVLILVGMMIALIIVANLIA